MSVVKTLNHCSIVPVRQAAPRLTLGSSIHQANAKQRKKNYEACACMVYWVGPCCKALYSYIPTLRNAGEVCTGQTPSKNWVVVQKPPFWGNNHRACLPTSPQTTLTKLIKLEMNKQLTLLDYHLHFLQTDTSIHQLCFHGFKAWLRNAVQN